MVFGSKSVLCKSRLLEKNQIGGIRATRMIYVFKELNIMGAVEYMKITMMPIPIRIRARSKVLIENNR